jgi:hypothetical protein
MSKEYFGHDYGARTDSKIMRLRMSAHGWAAVGIYWALVELMHERAGHISESDIEVIEYELTAGVMRPQYECNTDVLRHVLDTCFKRVDGGYTCDRVEYNLEIKSTKSQQAREAVNIRWKDKQKDKIKDTPKHTDVLRNDTKESKLKETKVKESKEIITPRASAQGERDINSLVKKALTPTAQARTFTPKEIGAMFTQIWAKYPRKEGMKEAFRHFTASIKNERDLIDIQSALKNYKAHLIAANTEPQFVKQGATWFNNWRDWIISPVPTAPAAKIWTPPPMSESDKTESERLNAELMAGLAEPPIVDDLSNAL